MLKRLKLIARWLKYRAEYYLLYLVFKMFGHVKIQTTSNICGFFGRWIIKFICVLSGHHKRALASLSLCFPSKTLEEKQRIMNKFYEGTGRFIGEYINQDQMDEKYFSENVEVINGEILDKYFESGFFAISGHFGNWEIGHKYFQMRNHTLSAIYKKQGNALIEGKFIAKKRPIELIHKSSLAMKQVVHLIREKKIIAILLDQRDAKGERFDFFGRGAKTGVAIQRLSLKYNYPMIGIKCLRKRDDPNKFKIVISRVFDVERTGDLSEDTKNLTKETLRELEAWITEDPEQWIWIYNRWK